MADRDNSGFARNGTILEDWFCLLEYRCYKMWDLGHEVGNRTGKDMMD